MIPAGPRLQNRHGVAEVKLAPAVTWRFAEGDEGVLDPRVLPLLRAIARHASLRAAAERCGLSYRAAWGLLRDCERRFGAPLARLAQGIGASLAPAGESLVQADDAASRRLASARGLAVEIGGSRAPAEAPGVRIAASHDIALAHLRDALPAAGALRLEVAITGSLDALKAYARGEVEMAGFHYAPALAGGRDHPFRGLLDASRDRMLGFAEREQGLILPAGNVHRVRSLRDLARRGLRFVNRQPGSGTRVVLDALLARAGIVPESIPGYAHAERNHVAVAGAVASGAADAGFGLRAAAAEFGLAFVPLARERYLFAVRAAQVESETIRAFVALLRGPLCARVLAGLPGYDGSIAGRWVAGGTWSRVPRRTGAGARQARR